MRRVSFCFPNSLLCQASSSPFLPEERFAKANEEGILCGEIVPQESFERSLLAEAFSEIGSLCYLEQMPPIANLECSRCHKSVSAATPQTLCPDCSGSLYVRYDLRPLRGTGE